MSKKTMTLEEQLAELRAENEALKTKAAHKTGITPKVSAKGALSVYGLGRFPVTLYRGQWENLIANTDKIIAFIKANEAALKTKESMSPSVM